MINKNIINNLFGIEGLSIAWYGIIIVIGIMFGCIIACGEAKRQKLKSDIVFDFLLLSLPIAIICARLYYVIFEWEQYSGNLIKVFAIREGGLAIYGGIIGGFIASIIFSKRNQFPFLRLADLFVPSLVIGQIIGRWGNFVNQEAFGNIVAIPKLQFFPYAVYIEQLQEWHQATFFYESMWNIGVFTLLILYRRKSKFYGCLLAIYFIGYGIGRFWIEGLRADSLYLFPGFRVSQGLSVILIIAGTVLLIFHKEIVKSTSTYSGKYAV